MSDEDDRKQGIDLAISQENAAAGYEGREFGEVDLDGDDVLHAPPPTVSGDPNPGGPNHANMHIPAPSYKGIKNGLLSLITLIVIAFGWELYFVISDALAKNWMLAALYVAIIVVMMSLALRYLWNFLYDKKDISEMLLIRKTAKEIIETYNTPGKNANNSKTKKAEKLIHDLAKLYSKKPQQEYFDLCLKKMPDYSDDREMVRHIDNVFLKPLDREAMRRISEHCLQTGTVVAMSPWAAIDMAFALWRNTRMIGEVGELYGFRPSVANRYRLLKNLIAHMAYLGVSELLTSQLTEEFLAQSVIGKASARIGQGVGASIFTARIGLLAMSISRPIEFDANEKPTAGMMVEPIIDSLVEAVKSRQPEEGSPA